ncbi:hypothetical protein ACHAW6_012242 [Cyclotella cf. meneghiniana]
MLRFLINGKYDDAFERIRGIDTGIKSFELRCDIHDYHTDDEDFGLLGRCIGQNKSIKEVTIYVFNNDRPLSGILARKWEAFFDGMSQSQSIKSIIFNFCHLGGHILKLFDTPNLNKLVVCGSAYNMREEHWQVVSDVLSSPVTALKVLELVLCSIDDASADALASRLVHSNTLEKLRLSSLTSITAHGWLSIFSSLQKSNFPLKHISLGYSETINDEVVSLLGDVLTAKKHTIEEFCIIGCREITSAGWTALSAAFCTPMLNLTELAIGNVNFGDDALVAFANGLCNKPSLRVVDLGDSNVTQRGWESIAKALCDASSLEAIRESNHTLQLIHVKSMPSNITKLLEINRSGDPPEAIRLKILNYSDKITMESLVDAKPRMQLKLVPSVISLLGRAGDKHTALYNFVRNQSYLLEEARKNASVCVEGSHQRRKRERDDDH